MNIPHFIYPSYCDGIWSASNIWLFCYEYYIDVLWQYSFENVHSYLLYVFLRVELLDHRLSICLSLIYAAKQFSKLVVPIYTLTINVRKQDFQFSHILANTCYCRVFFCSNHPNECEVVSCCSFDLQFPDDCSSLQPGLLYPAKISFRVEGQIKSFPDKKN